MASIGIAPEIADYSDSSPVCESFKLVKRIDELDFIPQPLPLYFDSSPVCESFKLVKRIDELDFTPQPLPQPLPLSSSHPLHFLAKIKSF